MHNTIKNGQISLTIYIASAYEVGRFDSRNGIDKIGSKSTIQIKDVALGIFHLRVYLYDFTTLSQA